MQHQLSRGNRVPITTARPKHKKSGAQKIYRKCRVIMDRDAFETPAFVALRRAG